MVCFEVLLAYPYSPRDVINTMNEKKLEYLRKVHLADYIGTYIENNTVYLQLAICDDDAVSLLRDVPPSVYCVWIKFLRSEIFLYSNKKVTGTSVIPPRLHLLKKIYWSASQLERRRVL